MSNTLLAEENIAIYLIRDFNNLGQVIILLRRNEKLT